MAGMYPDNETLDLFGEEVSWPGVDKDGKFTNGSFSDPAVKPSFIPAQTVNLILDNLSELLIALGKTPNNKDAKQLSSAVTAALALKANLASPTFTGTVKVPSKTNAAASDGTLVATEAQVALKANLASPTFTGTVKVPSKTSAATSDGTLVATEAQVALKANLASPALTGTPTTPTAAVKNNSTQIATTAYADRAGHPVNSCYTQYPVTGQSTIANMFPSSESPATLFGGTWSEMYASEDVYFRTGALGSYRGQTWSGSVYTSNGATVGVEPDAARKITASAAIERSNIADATGAFRRRGSGKNARVTSGSYEYDYLELDTSLVSPTDTTNHPKNRLIKVWKRTA